MCDINLLSPSPVTPHCPQPSLSVLVVRFLNPGCLLETRGNFKNRQISGICQIFWQNSGLMGLGSGLQICPGNEGNENAQPGLGTRSLVKGDLENNFFLLTALFIERSSFLLKYLFYLLPSYLPWLTTSFKFFPSCKGSSLKKLFLTSPSPFNGMPYLSHLNFYKMSLSPYFSICISRHNLP